MALATENVSYIRQNAILNPERAANLHITIAGCGTVGSNAAVQLARAGFKKFHLIDMDAVEHHNLPSQAFPISALGVNKAEALEAELRLITDDLEVEVQTWELMGGEQFTQGVLLSAVDSMEMRKALFEQSAVANPLIELFMDFRMGGNLLQAWALNPQDERRAKQYADTLFSSEEAVEAECGGRTFAPVGALSGAIATQFLTKHLRDDDHPPFYTMFDFDNFQLTTIGRKKTDA